MMAQSGEAEVGLEAPLKSLTVHALNGENEEEREKLIVLVKEELVLRETCPSWLEDVPKIPSNELENILRTYTRGFEDFAQHTEEDESDLKYSAVETVAKRCVQAYILVIQKYYDGVASILVEGTTLIHHCVQQNYFSHLYARGFRYVLNTLDIFSHIQKHQDESRKLDVDTLRTHLHILSTFDELSVKEKVGVFALKMYFLGKMIRGRSYQKQIDITLKMIEMDPENSEWRCCLYFLAKFLRVSIDAYSPPSELEKKGILDALQVHEESGQEPDSRILIGRITCLAEILRNQLKNVWDGPLRFGTLEFHSSEEVVHFIKTEAEKIVSLDPVSIRSNVYLAKIFSSILPFEVQDREFARTCIERAVKFNPNSSKTNHRMGVFYLFTNTEIPRALVFIKKAYETDQRNILALLDLLHIYLGDVDKYDAELRTTFDSALSSVFFNSVPQHYADLLFAKAMYAFLKGRSSECIALILKAHSVWPEITKSFVDIPRFVKRFRWYCNVNGSKMLAQIQELLATQHSLSTDPALREQLEQLRTGADQAQKATEEQEAKSRLCGRGRGRGGGRDSTATNAFPSFARGFGGGTRGNRARGRGSVSRSNASEETQDWRNSCGTQVRSNGGKGRGEGSWRFVGRGASRRGQERGRGGLRGTREDCGSADSGDNVTSNWRVSSSKNPSVPITGTNLPNQETTKKVTESVFRSTQENHHEVLGVAETASPADVRKAYLVLAREYHGDRNKDLPEAERLQVQKKMEKINNAWEYLQRRSN